jgi:hypothetical protein
MEWQGDHPFFLLIEADDPTHGTVSIDLDQRGWAERYASFLRIPSVWSLISKASSNPVFRMVVLDGEQPYYTRRTVGIAGSGGSNSVSFIGIGKKRNDGHVDRLWLGPDGVAVTGDDVDLLGTRLLKRLGPRP